MTALVARSLLFVPATRPDMVAKVGRSRPDVVVLDLEDAVAPGDKDSARVTAAETLTAERPGAGTVLLRINAPGTPWHDEDVRTVVGLLAGGHVDGAVLPMYEAPDQLADLRGALGGDARVVVGLESVRGIADARELLAAGPDGVYFGAEDFAASIGGRRTTGGTEVLYARSRVALFAALHGVTSLDQVVTAVKDADAFRTDARQALDLGFRGKVCLHPIQVEVAHEVFTPTDDEVAHAREILTAGESGVGLVNGEMVDAVHLTMARTVLARAGESV
ncbi:HpcH/HpaI aldolase/citrate lyase family protein [Pseudonocardia endophytica]|uniref:Citrate lyase subunit beta/citryl-CoA lyase n=1 Tax=Pseudonocardia endophytica TaxID=401976 RepID=A0A4R1HY06_PSEEN|nr:CoA ester lyase [Pseudonocardia endophytica]TCK27268.1 citrate lyase subunit beta/citryl-CoA lyase [Pseudonocardia endophytica]